MISAFDKNGAAMLYKREFTESLYSGNYESALDNLLKYNEKVGYTDFHLACGKLYLLMAQDSDDNELLVMSFRELMMHIRIYPNCKSAYRDLIAVQMLRHDPAGALECIEFAKSNGINTEGMFELLSEAGVDLFMDESVGLDLDGLMEPGEFGEIEIVEQAREINEDTDIDIGDRKPRILKFNDKNINNANIESEVRSQKRKKNKIISILSDGGDISISEMIGEADGGELEFSNDDSEEELPPELLARLRNSDLSKRTGFSAQLALRDAEKFGAQGDFAKAFSALSNIKPSDGHYYYCAECLRAFMFIQNGDEENALTAIDNAFGIHPRGALACTLLCKIYENARQYGKIPEVLKSADVKDYTDADHVYQAMMLAVKYCKPNDAIALAESYIDEFNTMDIRMLYAQLLYNNGNRKRAIREMYALSRIFYDDFNTQYYYKQALSDVDRMPIDEQAPQEVLARIIDGLILIHKSGVPSDELIKSDDYKFAFELFLTLEFPRSHTMLKGMFEVLRSVVLDKRFEQKLRDSLVSPYVEPIVKAIILSEFLRDDTGFTIAVNFLPDSNVLTNISQNYSSGLKTASAYVLCMDRALYNKFSELADNVQPIFKNASFVPDRDIAYYMLKKLKSKSLSDGRVITALGFESKTEANAVFKAVDSLVNSQK